MMKKILLFIMVLVSMSASAESSLDAYKQDFKSNGIYYQIQKDKYNSVVVTGNYDDLDKSGDYTGKVVIPEAVTHNGTSYKVVGIGPYAFYKSPGITSVDMSACHYLEFIGEHAFDGECKVWQWHDDENQYGYYWDKMVGNSALTSVTWPSYYYNTQVKVSIGDYAFANCTKMTELVLDKNIGTVGTKAFMNTTGKLTCSMEYITANTFEQGGFTSAYIDCNSINAYAFYRCEKLKTVEIGPTLSMYNSAAFALCSKLETFIVDPRNECITVLYGCIYSKNLSTLVACPATMDIVDVYEGATSISTNAFLTCTPCLIVLSTSVPPTFHGELGGHAKLMIPYGSKDAYAADEYWNKALGLYFSAVEPSEDVNNDGKVNATDAMQIYNYILSH